MGVFGARGGWLLVMGAAQIAAVCGCDSGSTGGSGSAACSRGLRAAPCTDASPPLDADAAPARIGPKPRHPIWTMPMMPGTRAIAAGQTGLWVLAGVDAPTLTKVDKSGSTAWTITLEQVDSGLVPHPADALAVRADGTALVAGPTVVFDRYGQGRRTDLWWNLYDQQGSLITARRPVGVTNPPYDGSHVVAAADGTGGFVVAATEVFLPANVAFIGVGPDGAQTFVREEQTDFAEYQTAPDLRGLRVQASGDLVLAVFYSGTGADLHGRGPKGEHGWVKRVGDREPIALATLGDGTIALGTAPTLRSQPATGISRTYTASGDLTAEFASDQTPRPALGMLDATHAIMAGPHLDDFVTGETSFFIGTFDFSAAGSFAWSDKRSNGGGTPLVDVGGGQAYVVARGEIEAYSVADLLAQD